MTAAADDVWLDAAEVYTMLGISKATFYRRRATEGFPEPSRILGCKRYSRASVQSWLAARRAERDCGGDAAFDDGEYDDEGMFDPPPDNGGFVSRLEE